MGVSGFDGDPVGGGVDEKELVVRAGSSSTPAASAPSTYSAVPDAWPLSYFRSAASARPAVRSPAARASSSSAREPGTTSVATAVVAIGPGTIAAAASSTIAHRSSTVPPAPPDSSGKATPKMPSWARPA